MTGQIFPPILQGECSNESNDPVSIVNDSIIVVTSFCAASIIDDDKGQDAEDGEKEERQPKDDLFDSMTVANIQNQVTLF